MPQRSIDKIVLDPQLADLLAIVKGARNGFTYGAKIRFPHALVMVFLFRSGTLREKFKIIFKATFQHARNLATFATIYKTVMLLLRSTSLDGKETSPHTFLAGLLGGYMVFGRGIQSSVNQQIVIYVFARVVLALARMSVQKGGAIPRESRERVTNNAWPVFAALSWASVMWLYRWHPGTIQPSLKSSMKYILPLQEYGTVYSDGLVETYIALPPVVTPFAIRLRSDGYIAPGLSMFVYIDGEYQVNRGRNSLQIPSGTTQKHHTNVDFVVRQKEESIPGGQFLGRQWMFGKPEDVTNAAHGTTNPASASSDYAGTIEVVVLRCEGLLRSQAPNPSSSEVHPRTFQPPFDTALGSFSSPRLEDAVIPSHAVNDLSDFGGLFDGATLLDEPRTHITNFGGDMAWDDDDEPNHTPHFNRDWYGEPYRGSHPPGQQHDIGMLRGGASREVSRESLPSSIPSSVPSSIPSPAIIINVNQPGAGTPGNLPWSTIGGQTNNDNSWQTWMHDYPPQQNSRRSMSHSSHHARGNGGNQREWGNNSNNAWNPSRPENGGDQNQKVSAGWGAADNDQQAQDSNVQGHGWDNNNNNNDNQNQQNTEWDHNNDYKDDQAKWNSNGDQNDQGNGGWGDDDQNNGKDTDQQHWESNGGNDNSGKSGWDDERNGNGANNHEQNGGGWNTNNGNGQDGGGWNDTANDDANGNGGNNKWDNEDNQNAGDAWDNANAGGKEPEASGDQGWNASGGGQAGWDQDPGANNSPPATGGGQDPWNSSNRHTHSSKAKSVKSNVSKPISFRSAVQNTGWGQANQSGPPGARPVTSQDASTGFKKPYYVITDAAGNPRVPDLNPAPVAVAPPPPPPPPIVPTQNSSYVQRGKPALYHHKVASPKYIDTHEKPYAVFVFRYRTKAALEHTLHTTISDSEEMQKAELASLSKEELIKQIIESKSKLGSVPSVHSVPASVNNSANGWNGNNNAGPGQSVNGFGATLQDKLAAAAAQQNNSSSSSSGDKNNQAWNNAPPGSPIANNTNGWNNQNNNNGNANGWPASEGGGGGHVAAWLNKTPTGRKVSGHEPWAQKGNESVKYSGGSNQGQSRNGSNENWGGSQKKNNGAHGSSGWKNESKGNTGWNGGGSQHGHGSQSAGWNGNGKSNGGQDGATAGANSGGEGPSSGW
ncbi:MAG: hypothetical protein Q9218_001977 [Villophora microphyllina]